MKTLIMSAMDLEVSKLDNLLNHKKYKEYIDVLVTGMGKVASASRLTNYLGKRDDIANIVLIGFAGALKPTIKKGELFVVDKVFQHDFGILKDARIYWHKPGLIDLSNKKNSKVEKVLYKLDTVDMEYKTATIATGDIFANDSDFSKSLSNYADLIDMETGAIAQVIETYYPKISLYSLRVVSDSASDSADKEFSLSVNEMLNTLNKGTEKLLDTLYQIN